MISEQTLIWDPNLLGMLPSSPKNRIFFLQCSLDRDNGASTVGKGCFSENEVHFLSYRDILIEFLRFFHKQCQKVH